MTYMSGTIKRALKGRARKHGQIKLHKIMALPT
jgi:hypothetical protein